MPDCSNSTRESGNASMHRHLINHSRRVVLKRLSSGAMVFVYGCGGADEMLLPSTTLSPAENAPLQQSVSIIPTAQPLQNSSPKQHAQPNNAQPSTSGEPEQETSRQIGDGATLVTPPSIVLYSGSTSIVGAVLKAIPATWQNEAPVERSGVVSSFSQESILLDTQASNTADYYVGMWVVVLNGGDFGQPNGIITRYDNQTKIAFIDSWRGIVPIAGKEWRILCNFPIQRSWQWMRNGTPIAGQVSATYTTQDRDMGTTVTVTETAGFIDPANNGLTAAAPARTATASSTGILVNQPAKNLRLVQQDDFEYMGSFKVPAAGVQHQSMPFFSDGAFFIRNKGGTNTAVIRGHTYTSCVGEFSTAVSLTKAGDYSALPEATLFENNPSAPLPLLSSKIDLSKAGVSRSKLSFIGVHGIPAGDIFFNLVGWLDYGPWVHFRRSANIYDQSASSVQGPFVIVDPLHQQNTRWTTGWYCDVPNEWQGRLGGDVIAGAGGPYISFSVNSYISHGPCGIVFDSNSVTATLATRNEGLARGGASSPATIQLADNASPIEGFYIGHYINVPGCTSVALRISAYNGQSRTATVEKWETVPSAGTTYNTIPFVSGRQLFGYPSDKGLEKGSTNGEFFPIWNFSTAIGGMCIPNGTDSLLSFAKTGDGLFTYAQSPIDGDRGIQRSGYRIYDPGNPEPGPHSNPTFYKVYAYDLNELAEVNSNKKSFFDIKPHGIFTLNLPNALTSISRRTIRGVAFDSRTRQIFISEVSGKYAAPIIHVFRMNRSK